MLIDDKWNGLADLLENLIAKYVSELDIGDMPDASHDREYNSESKIHQNRTFVVSKNR